MPGTPLPSKPGKSFVKMFDLIYTNNKFKVDFSDRLIIAIFWEETAFNNILQGGTGTAVGFGQVEPSNFWTLKQYSGLVMPKTRTEVIETKKGKIKKVHSTASLSDDIAVQATTNSLNYLHRIANFSREYCFKSYAGVKTAELDPTLKPTATERIAIINNWLACEKALKDVKPFKKPTKEEENVILDALQLAKPFKERREEWRPILFPPGDYT